MDLPARSVHRLLKRLWVQVPGTVPGMVFFQPEKVTAELTSAVPEGFVIMAPHLGCEQGFFLAPSKHVSAAVRTRGPHVPQVRVLPRSYLADEHSALDWRYTEALLRGI